jgi:(p)ppGpp synthase/HD superfamily hydrolase
MRTVDRAVDLAFSAHSLQTYDGKPYKNHLNEVVSEIEVICSTIDLPSDLLESLICCGYLHDLLEDCGFAASYNDLKKEFGIFVADICFALQTEKGKTRKERHSAKYYSEMSQVPFATFIKLCDRIANFRHSKKTASSMEVLYRNEVQNMIFLVDEARKRIYFSEEERILTEKALDRLCEEL